jgi:hypothetical protein
MGLLDTFLGNADQTQALSLLGANMMAGNTAQGLLSANQYMGEAPARRMKQQMAEMQMQEMQQKVEDARRQREFLSTLPSPQMQASMGALSGGGGPTNANAANIRPVNPIQDMMFRGTQAGVIGLPDYLKSMQPKELPFGKVDPKDYTPESIRAFAQSGGDHTRLVPVRKMDVVGNQAVDLYKAAPGTVFDSLDPNKPFNLQGGRVTPNAAFQDYETRKARAGASNVSVNTGQKGLDNELKIRSDFRSEPIYKAHQDVQSAHSQITQSLAQGSPAGDLAGATKLMKILDPGSVVRESELGMAMAASGLLDRAQNYAGMVMSGQKLTPTQRKDFKDLADKLHGESVKQYNAKRKEYSSFATGYNLDGDRILGPELGGAAPAAAPAGSADYVYWDGKLVPAR